MPNRTAVPAGAYLWTANDQDLYARLPIYMMKVQLELLKVYQRWPKLIKTVPWQPNQGFTMQGVSKNPSPVLRTQYIPNPITQQARKDVIEVRETKEQAQLYRHKFESQLFHFLPSFADFLTDSIDFTMEDINQKMAIFYDQFLRAAIFHASPYVYICGKSTELTAAAYWTGPNISLIKDQGALQTYVASATRTLDLQNMQKIAQVMYSDLGIPHYEGQTAGDGTNGEALKGKYCMIQSPEVWDNYVNDPFLQGNRALNLDIVTDSFKGSLFGRWTTMHERFEMRITADGTMPAPEIVEENPDAYDFGRTKPNPEFVSAPFGVAFGCGMGGYKAVKVGPPPRDFTGMTMKEFANLDWNGKAQITRNVNVNTLDQNGAVIQDTNKYGEYLQMIASMAMGILPVQRQNILPVIYLRARVGAN